MVIFYEWVGMGWALLWVGVAGNGSWSEMVTLFDISQK